MISRVNWTTPALAVWFVLAFIAGADAMTFVRSVDGGTVRASGMIERGDAARFADIPEFQTLRLDSPGGLVMEALKMAAEMDARGGIRTVVASGSTCASACAMVLFVSGETRVVEYGGRLGIHTCSGPAGTDAQACNKAMAANARDHGVPWGVIEGFGNLTKAADMTWFSAEEAECWGLLRWGPEDPAATGLTCWLWTMASVEKKVPADVTPDNADELSCRMNARTSFIHIDNGNREQGFTDAYRTTCRKVAADIVTSKYAAIDILLWLTVSDPGIWALKPRNMLQEILGDERGQAVNCWKCLVIVGMTDLVGGDTGNGLPNLLKAAAIIERGGHKVPPWLKSRIDVAITEAARRR